MRRAEPKTMAVITLVVAATLATRLWWEMTAGVFVVKEYDDGVYYRASVLLAEGGALYRDQVFLHPPGLPLLLVPSAWVGGVIGDPWGFVAARLLVVALSTTVAVGLTLHVRAVAGLTGGASAGLLYAVHPCVVWAGDTVMMEPFLDAATLLGVVLLAVPGSRRAMLAGASLGVAAAVKLWALVPTAVLAAGLLLQQRARDALSLLGNAATAAILLLLVALRAPAQAWDQVVLAQAGRDPDGIVGLGPRLTILTGTWTLPRPFAVGAALVAVSVVAAATGAIARRSPWLLVWPALAVTWATALLLAPTFWPHYGSVLVLPVATCLGVAVGIVLDRVHGRGRNAAALALVAAAPLALLVGSRGAYPWAEEPVLVAERPGECRSDDPPGVQALADAVPERIDGCVSPLDPAGIRILAEQQGRG